MRYRISGQLAGRSEPGRLEVDTTSEVEARAYAVLSGWAVESVEPRDPLPPRPVERRERPRGPLGRRLRQLRGCALGCATGAFFGLLLALPVAAVGARFCSRRAPPARSSSSTC